MRVIFVLPFKSSLLEPATRQLHALYAGVVQYRLEDGDVGAAPHSAFRIPDSLFFLEKQPL
ncbi:MAG TPA: hypothetical protein VKV04_00790 [Verrucomicrobiae bacterium]|nr:hypothetical protein [Verrucomicrobiae bacterium]